MHDGVTCVSVSRMVTKIFQMLLLLIFSSHVTKRCLGWKSHLKPIISVRNRLCYNAHGYQADSESPFLNKKDEEYGNSIGSNREVIKGSNTGLLPNPPSPSNFPSWAYEPRDFFHFELIYQSKKSMARVGRIHTPHGIIDTPGFVAVATNGALKGIDFRDADDAGQQLVFCNTYHLLLQPGSEVVAHAGGLHKFINRPNRPLITDSGGFQVFSLAYGSVHEELSSKGELKRTNTQKNNRYRNSYHDERSDGLSESQNPMVKVTEEGVEFRSYRG
jgi:hypothetical protein